MLDLDSNPLPAARSRLQRLAGLLRAATSRHRLLTRLDGSLAGTRDLARLGNLAGLHGHLTRLHGLLACLDQLTRLGDNLASLAGAAASTLLASAAGAAAATISGLLAAIVARTLHLTLLLASAVAATATIGGLLASATAAAATLLLSANLGGSYGKRAR